jgi:dUTP pyrophosphatase
MIKVKRVHPDAKLPTRANPDDAGADLCSVEHIVIPPLSRALVSTGLTIEMPSDNLYARIAPRSGLALKHGIDVLAGVIDKGYRGVIGVILYNTDQSHAFEVKPGDRIAQIIIENAYSVVFNEREELSSSIRSDKGFGSSGINY